MIPERSLWEQTKNSRGYLTLSAALGWVGGVLILFQAVALSRVITALFLQGQTIPELVPWFGGLLGIFILRSLLVVFSEMSAHTASSRIRAALRRMLLEHILALGPAFARDEKTGEQVAAAMQGVDNLDGYFSQYLPQVALAALIPFSVLVVAFPIDWVSGLVLVLTAPLIPIFMVLIGQASAAVSRKQFQALGRMSAFLLDTLQGLTTLKLLNQSQKQVSRIQRVSERYRHATMDVLRVAFLSALVLEWVGTLSTAVIAVQIGLRLLHGGLGFEQAFIILLLAPEFYLPLRLLGMRFHAAETGRAAAQKIFKVLAVPLPLRPQISQSVQAPVSVEFDGVGYHYADRALPVLEDVSFTLKPGQLTALVGSSGAGKTTAVSLLEGFIQPSKGQIRVNGVDLSLVSRENWRANVAWMPQQVHLFHGSIAENMRIANATASQVQLEQAARLAQLDHFIEGLPQGYQTVVGEGGVGISGGQAQRLALARAFLADAPFLIVDEPVAWLDPELEQALNESLFALSRERTVLMIAHRRSTVMRCDWVLVLEDGRIGEQGEPQQLLNAKGAFFHLFMENEALL